MGDASYGECDNSRRDALYPVAAEEYLTAHHPFPNRNEGIPASSKEKIQYP